MQRKTLCISISLIHIFFFFNLLKITLSVQYIFYVNKNFEINTTFINYSCINFFYHVARYLKVVWYTVLNGLSGDFNCLTLAIRFAERQDYFFKNVIHLLFLSASKVLQLPFMSWRFCSWIIDVHSWIENISTYAEDRYTADVPVFQ